MRSRSIRSAFPARRWWIATILGAVLALASSCGRPPAPRIAPDTAIPGLAAWRESTAAICTRVTRFEARGRFAVTMNEMRASAGETFYFEAPDRMRMELDFPGYLWVPPASGDVLVRGDSLYVVIPGLIDPWRGTRAEFIADWSWRAALTLGILGALDPRGPLGCDPAAADIVLRDLGKKQVSAESVRGGLFWQLAVDRATGSVGGLHFRVPGDRDYGRADWSRIRDLDGLLLPSGVSIRWEDQHLLIHIEQDERYLNPPLPAGLFDPGNFFDSRGLDGSEGGVGG